ncbi:MAG: hypothetical protein KGJ84_04135 [Elusimicrobia bacterium]|nr:hypothetical protein [Elusimicrobiota bacterium]
MRRIALPFLLSAALAGCVSVAPMPDPRGALRPGQRLVVAVYVAPGPWIVDAADTKAEAAAKISPVGFLMQTVQDEHTLKVSKDLQQYMPRPHYGDEFQDPFLKALRLSLSTGAVQTGLEAGIVPAQLSDWNNAKDQYDWRSRYYFPDPDAPAPRDYARILTLDDALILDVNVSFGTTAGDDDRIMPVMSADSRVYRGDTTHLLWEHEDIVTDQTSSSTLVDFRLNPADLTDRLQSLAPKLAKASSDSFLKAFGIAAPVVPVSSATVSGSTAPYGNARAFGSGGGGLVPMTFFQNMPHGPPGTGGVAASTSPVITPAISTAPASPPAP